MNRRFIRHRIYNIINDDFGLTGRKSLHVCSVCGFARIVFFALHEKYYCNFFFHFFVF